MCLQHREHAHLVQEDRFRIETLLQEQHTLRAISRIMPITSQLKRTPYHVRFTHDGIEYAVIISQVRLLNTRRLRRRIFRMPEDIFGEVLSALQQMIGQGT